MTLASHCHSIALGPGKGPEKAPAGLGAGLQDSQGNYIFLA